MDHEVAIELAASICKSERTDVSVYLDHLGTIKVGRTAEIRDASIVLERIYPTNDID